MVDSKQIAQNLIDQTISDEKARMNNTKVDIVSLETPRKEGDKLLSMQTTDYSRSYDLTKAIDIEKQRELMKPKYNPNLKEEGMILKNGN